MSDLNKISEEEENYLQLMRLLNNLALKAVRIKFNQYFPTQTLLDTILKNEESRLKNMRLLRSDQLNLLFPSSGKLFSKYYTTEICDEQAWAK